MNKRSKGAIKGIVQGVGFRPFICQLAHRYHLRGHVINTSGGVDLEVEEGKVYSPNGTEVGMVKADGDIYLIGAAAIVILL